MASDYDIETHEYLRHGVKVLQAAMFAPTEAEHVAILHRLYAPPHGATVIDMGAGTGAVAAGFVGIDPSLTVYCVTNSRAQARLIRAPLVAVLADFASTGLPAASAELVMFNESFGYGDPAALMDEAARLLAPGGRLAIKDLRPAGGDPSEASAEAAWSYRFHPVDVIVRHAKAAGLAPVRVLDDVPATMARFDALLKASPLLRELHGNAGTSLRAVVYLFERPA